MSAFPLRTVLLGLAVALASACAPGLPPRPPAPAAEPGPPPPSPGVSSSPAPRVFPRALPPFRSLALGADGRLLACAPERGVLLFDLPGQALRDLAVVDGPYYESGYSPGTPALRACDVAFPAEGPSALTLHTTSYLVRWNMDVGRPGDMASDQSSRFVHAAFTPDGSRVLAIARSGLVWDWRLADGVVLHHFVAAPDARSIAPTPDGEGLWIVTHSGAVLFDLATQAEVRRTSEPDLEVVLPTPAGTWGVAHNGRTMWLWDLERHRVLQIFGPSTEMRSYRFSPDRSLLMTSAFGPVSVWDTVRGGLKYSLASPATGLWVYGLDVAPDGKRALTGSGTNAMELWDLETGKPLAQYPHPAFVAFVGFLPDGERAVSISGRDYNGGATARVFRLADRSVLRTFRVQENMAEIAALSPSGKELLTSGDGGSDLRLFSTDTGELIRTLGAPLAEVRVIALAGGGARSLTGDASGIVRVWKEGGRAVERILPPQRGPIGALAISETGRWGLTSASGDATRLWALDAGGLIRELGPPTPALAFDREERVAFVGAEDGGVAEWNLGSGREVAKLGADARCDAVAVTPDGTRVLTGHADGTVRVWDRATHQELATRTGDGSGIVALAASADRVASAAANGTVRLWRLSGEGSVALTAGAGQWIAYTDDGAYLGSSGADTLVTGLGSPPQSPAGRDPARVLARLGLRAAPVPPGGP